MTTNHGLAGDLKHFFEREEIPFEVLQEGAAQSLIQVSVGTTEFQGKFAVAIAEDPREMDVQSPPVLHLGTGEALAHIVAAIAEKFDAPILVLDPDTGFLSIRISGSFPSGCDLDHDANSLIHTCLEFYADCLMAQGCCCDLALSALRTRGENKPVKTIEFPNSQRGEIR